jgi:hypothetical protein
VALHSDGALLPRREDATRLDLEGVFRFQADLKVEAPRALAAAEEQAGEPFRFSITRLQIECELLVIPSDELEEVWLAVSALSGGRKHRDEKVRQFVFAVFRQEARAAQWDERRDEAEPMRRGGSGNRRLVIPVRERGRAAGSRASSHLESQRFV